jgi:hypothetical protein
MESDTFEILVGASSRDIHLRAKVDIQGNTLASAIPQLAVYAQFPADARVSKADFETLLGKAMPDNARGPKLYSLNAPIVDMRDSFIRSILE